MTDANSSTNTPYCPYATIQCTKGGPKCQEGYDHYCQVIYTTSISCKPVIL